MNAIILAAGLGSRLKELTKSKHKALFEIGSLPNIERTILYLHENGVSEIYIVVGYLADSFSYLENKYGVKLIYNADYALKNNLASFYLSLPYFGDSFVIDADVVMLKNIFHSETRSVYYTTLRGGISGKNEWIVKLKSDRVVSIEISDKFDLGLLGISFFNKFDAKLIKEKIFSMKDDAFCDPSLYWDNIAIGMLDVLNIGVRVIDNKFVHEIDDVYDLSCVEKKINLLKLNG